MSQLRRLQRTKKLKKIIKRRPKLRKMMKKSSRNK
jgi:hypothetical protein